jgi:hypothetical protein
MDTQKVIVAWIFLAVFIAIIFVILKRQAKYKQDKLDFVSWYWENKKEVLNRVQRRAKLYNLDLESELDKEYEAYLQS